MSSQSATVRMLRTGFKGTLLFGIFLALMLEQMAVWLIGRELTTYGIYAILALIFVHLVYYLWKGWTVWTVLRGGD